MSRVYDNTVSSLGEGPLWHPTRGQLYWFDIHGRALRTHEDGQTRSWSFDEEVSAAGWTSDTHLLVASETRLFQFNVETGACLKQKMYSVNTYPVEVRDGYVWVAVGDSNAP